MNDDIAQTLHAMEAGVLPLPTPQLRIDAKDALLRAALPPGLAVLNLTDFNDGRAWSFLVYAARQPGLAEMGPAYHRALDALGGKVDGFRVLLSALGPFASVEPRVFRKAPPAPFYDVVDAPTSAAGVEALAALVAGLTRAGYRILAPTELAEPVPMGTELKEPGEATVADALFEG